MSESYNICFISGKLGDVDGVSLEADKWISVLSRMGHQIFTVAGQYLRLLEHVPESRSLLIDKLSFSSKRQQYYESCIFPHLDYRKPRLSEKKLEVLKNELQREGRSISDEIYDFIITQNIDFIIAENTNAMPMTLLGASAVYDLTQRKSVAALFHHHDFWWERSRFSDCLLDSFLNVIMPPVSISNEHIVVSSYAEHILNSVKRVQPYVIPNCEDFENPPLKDEYNSHFREDMGFCDDDILIIQPTRIVPRKRIEDSIQLTALLGRRYPELAGRIRFVISLYPGDEAESDYLQIVRKAAEEAELELHLIYPRIRAERMILEGERFYTNRDVLVNADLVSYLPRWEGFGNALLEAFAARVPVVTSTYLVYKTDIRGSGVRPVEIRDRYDRMGNLIIEEHVLEEIHSVLTDPVERKMRVDLSFKSAARDFSMNLLEKKLTELIDSYSDEIRAGRRRLQKSRQSYYV
ncbi:MULTISPECIES: glycosyltransferase family 4 protein [unclassified Oceanispirochaeta]|uniref:glycosyltransferase family 4 protein n=1 Tax=unclassified Oceanispirochaeta TaxID=2635722 RepID=UPI001E630536|nr:MULTISPECIES: glycosyltransferase family 4 protein [unclassified Oceanispirochaeta]